jgi:TatD family hydrolase
MAQASENQSEKVSTSQSSVVDIGINLTHKSFRKHWKEVVQRAVDAGVDKMILTGTSIQSSRESLALAQEWWEETGSRNLYVTVGIHPHDAKTWNDDTTTTTTSTLAEMKQLLEHPLAVAVGECGLDFNRNFSSREDQIHAFREQVKLACELKKPLFLHEREAHADLIRVLDEMKEEQQQELPPIVVHCFTGTKVEAMEYIQRGYYIGFTGTICKKDRGAPLRELLPQIPLDKIMVETDTPFMGFKKGRRSSEPADCVDVARKLAETMDKSFPTICDTTTASAIEFFGLEK